MSERVLHFRVFEDFVKPALTEDGAVGHGNKFAVMANSQYNASYAPYKSFQNDSGNYPALSKNALPTTTDPYLYTMYFPLGAKLTSIAHTNRGTGANACKDIELLGSNDESHWTSLVTYTNTNNTANSIWTVNIPASKQDVYRYYRYKVTSTNNTSGYTTLGFLKPVGVWKNPERIYEVPLFDKGNINLKSASNGADISAPIRKDRKLQYGAYGDIFNPYSLPIRCKVPNRQYRSDGTVRKYYRKTTFSRPNLTSDGVVEADSFACLYPDYYSSQYAWYCFDSSATTYWRCTKGAGAWIGFFYKYPLNVTKLTWTNQSTAPTSYEVQVSHNGEDWKSIYSGSNSTTTNGGSWSIDLSSNTDYYRYYRVYVISVSSGVTYCRDLKITGTYLTEATSSSYDLYIDTNDYLLSWQIVSGSYQFTSAGTFTFTVPRGVKNVLVECGTGDSYSSAQYVYNAETGDVWSDVYVVDEGSGEDTNYVTYSNNNYVRVTGGKTYTLTITSSSMTTYPKISWSKEINNTPTTLINE